MKRVPFFLAWLLCQAVVVITFAIIDQHDLWHNLSLLCWLIIAVLSCPPAREWVRNAYHVPLPIGPSALLVLIIGSAAVAFCSISPALPSKPTQKEAGTTIQEPIPEAVQFDLLKREASVQVGEQTLDERIGLIGIPSDADLQPFLEQQAAAAQSQGFAKIFIYAYSSKQSYLNSPLSWRARAMLVPADGDTEAKVTFNDPALIQLGDKPESDLPASQGKWQFSESVSAIDDSKTSVLSVEADAPVQVWLKSVTPTLFLRCRKGTLDVLVQLNTEPNPEYGDDTASVRVRLDKGPPVSQSWLTTTTNDALIAQASRRLIARLSKAQSMLFEFTPYNAPRAVVTFDVSGLAEAQKALPKSCQTR